MNFEDIEGQVDQIISGVLGLQGLVLFGSKIRMKNKSLSIEVFADKENGGITVGECSGVNRKIVEDEDLNELLPDGYMVEVSSPGIDWPLKTEKDFNRVIGTEVDLYLGESIEDKLQYSGKVKIARDGVVEIEGKSGIILIPLENINKALPKI